MTGLIASIAEVLVAVQAGLGTIARDMTWLATVVARAIVRVTITIATATTSTSSLASPVGSRRAILTRRRRALILVTFIDDGALFSQMPCLFALEASLRCGLFAVAL